MKTYEVGYSAFIAVFGRDSTGHWYGFRVETDGLWVDQPPVDLCLTDGDEALLTRHPTGRMNEPALPFPCSIDKLKEFLEWCGYGEMDDDDEADLEKALQEYGVAVEAAPIKRLKKAALISKHKEHWPTVTNDLQHSDENGLAEAAGLPVHGFWNESAALIWAEERGKLTDTNKPDNFSLGTTWNPRR
jgi:hypothetical protein